MDRRKVTTPVAVIFGVGALLLGASAAARAQSITTYTTLASWQTAVGNSPQFTTNFAPVTQDLSFAQVPVNFGAFTLQQVGTDPNYGTLENFIDVPPVQFTDNSGKTNAAIYTKYGLVTVTMAFATPVTAWGANFYGAQSGELENLVLTDTGGNQVSTVPVSVNTGFFGFTESGGTGIKTISFQSQISNPDPSVGQGFGLDGIVETCNTACVPATAFFTPSPLNFGTVAVGTQGPIITTTLTNNTHSPVTYLSETNTPSFLMSNGSCMVSLAAGASCTFSVEFVPLAAGAASGSLTVKSVNGPITLNGSGTGSVGPMYFTPSFFDFGNVTVGTTSAPVKVTLTNKSGATATDLGQFGTSELHFAPGTCTKSLVTGASCSFSVTFAPTAVGLVGGAVEYNTASGLVVFETGGTGLAKK